MSHVASEQDAHPWAWLFFIVYILASTYIVLNLFIAVAVEALEMQQDDETREIVDEIEEGDTEILAALADLKAEVASLRAELADRR
jgi:voltage-gated sodium channel